MKSEQPTLFHQKLTNIVLLIYSVFNSLFTHTIGLPLIGFLGVSFPLFFIKFNFFSILAYYYLNSIAFFDPFFSSSKTIGLIIPDIILIFFLFSVLIRKQNPFRVTVPFDYMLLLIYLLVTYVLIMSVKPLLVMGRDFYVVSDIREILLFLLVPIFAFNKEFTFKVGIKLLLVIVTASAIWSLYIIYQYILTLDRVLTWNETFFGDAILIISMCLIYLNSKRIKSYLVLLLILNIFALLYTQTRSIWLSTAICLFVIFLVYFFKNMKVLLSNKNMWISIAALFFVILFSSFFKLNIAGIIGKRFSEFSVEELYQPQSSTGYRIYETYMVFKERTLFGHGSGARIHIVNTQTKKMKWRYWWSIHCEYAEILHKYGIVGLSVFSALIIVFMYRAIKLINSTKKNLRFFGLVSLVIMLNHCIISISSGYIIRDNIVPFLVLFFAFIEIAWIRRKKYLLLRKRSLNHV
jgi:O-antigen ligase